MRSITVAMTLALLLAADGAVAAQAPAATPNPAAKTPPKATAPAKPRTAASLQCSKDADAKNIHGKPRKAFMSSCKKAGAKS